MLVVIAEHCTIAFGADYYPSVTIVSDENTYTVSSDGTSIHDQTRIIHIENDEGVKTYGQITYRYSNEFEKFEVLEAYTTTRDGTRIDVPPDAIFTRQSPLSAYAPTFDDNLVKTIVFPGVEPGASITMRTREIQATPLFPGQFSANQTFTDEKAIKSASVTIRAPSSMKLHADVIDMPGGMVSADVNGEQTWRWSLTDTLAHPSEVYSPSLADRSPRLAITTFPNYEAVGQAYLSRAQLKAAISPDIQEIADGVTTGITDRRDQADAIYQWVSRNIRYVAIYLGFGGSFHTLHRMC